MGLWSVCLRIRLPQGCDRFASESNCRLRHIYPHIHTDFTDTLTDFADATRGYPTDFTDESNRLNLIPLRIALSVKSVLRMQTEPSHEDAWVRFTS